MMTDITPPPLEPEAPRPGLLQRLSLIWIVPIVALAVTLGIAWSVYSSRGQLIQIEFEDATGVVAGQTQLRFREVQVGLVESTGFTPDLTRVVLNVRVNNDVARFIDADARFWLVRPEVSAQGISRLDTVFSGVFIEGYWDDKPAAPQTSFAGFPRQPSDVMRVPGTMITLRVEDAGGLSDGMAILYRGMTVGRVQTVRLGPGGDRVLADAWVDAPYDRFLSTASVFWDASGFTVSVGAQGLTLDVRSLATLVQGGVEFTTPVSGGSPLTPGQEFRLFPTEDEARDSLFVGAEGAVVTVAVLLDGAVRGLAEGAPVHYQGLPVGEVANLSVVLIPRPEGGEVAMQRAILSLRAARMGLGPDTTADGTLDFLAQEVENGLRARVASTGLLGTTLVVELVQLADQGPATLDRTAQPYPLLPGAPPAVADPRATAEGLFARLNSLPIEEVLGAATNFLNGATALISSPELRETPGALRDLMAEARNLIGSEQVQGVPQQITDVLNEVRQLAADLRTSGIDEKLANALDLVALTAGQIGEATTGMPELITSVRDVARQAAQVRFAELGDRAAALMAQLEGVMGTQDLRATPGRVNETLAELSALLQTLREGGAAETLNATLNSAQAAADGVARASEDLPALTARLDGVVTRLDAMIATYGERSTFNAETLAALRELRRTAASVGSLAQTIERNPRALLTGR